MNEKYYTERLARQSAEQIVPIPEDLQIPQRYLNGISNDEFIAAFHTYQNILRRIYDDIAANPGSFGMICLDIDKSSSGHDRMGPVTSDESKSRKSFFHLSVILLAFACVGEFTSNGSLAVDTGKFLSYKFKLPGISALEIILKKLCDYGFEFEGMPDNFNIVDLKIVNFYYAYNR